MNKQEILSKLNAIAKPAEKWLEEAKFRIENRNSIQYSQEIAVKILRTLRDQKKTQIQLAEMLGVTPQQVNKWVKGSENLTLETIGKIDAALGIKLLTIELESQVQSIQFQETKTLFKHIPIAPRSYSNTLGNRNCKVINISDYNKPTKLAL